MLFEKGIINKTERDYLKAVFKPFWKKIVYVEKVNDLEGIQYIEVELENYDTMSFPVFEAGSMYKGMISDKLYTLDELGIKYTE